MTNDPGMRTTRWTDLVVPFVIVGLTAYVLLRFSYDSYLQLRYLVPAPLAALAVAEFVAARRVRAAVRHDPRARAMTAIVIARCVALGKASSLVGSGVAGAALGMIVRLLPDVSDVKVAAHDTTVGALLFGAALLLVAAGLLLERAGVDPGIDRRER
jgi:phosphate starvation-inducible membrane PsiE